MQPNEAYDDIQTIREDCDGFCLAIRHLLRKLTIANRLVYCEIGGIGHLVVEVEGWILDNRHDFVLADTVLKALGYKFLRISGFKPSEPWRLLNEYKKAN